MISRPALPRPLSRIWFSGLVVLLFLLVVGNRLPVHSQNPAPPPPTITGKTPAFALPPNGLVDCGPFDFILDSDSDGLPDDFELSQGLDPDDPADADLDPDNDGLTNGDEFRLGTSLTNSDTDGDSFMDGLEVQLGYDPLDPNSFPPSGVQVVSIQMTPAILGLSLNAQLGPVPFQLTVTGTLSDGSTVDLTQTVGTSYTSIAPATATVNVIGLITPVAPGSTLIRAQNGGFSAETMVTVSNFAPVLAGTVELPSPALGVDLSGRYAYVACGASGLQAVDLGFAESPQLLGVTGFLGGLAQDVKVVGNRAYVACGDGGLQVVDVSDPQFLQAVGSAPCLGSVDLVVKGDFAYIAAGVNGLVIVNISNPASPQVVGSLPTAPLIATAVDVDPARNVVVLTARPPALPMVGEIDVIDVTNPAAPVRQATAPSLGGLNSPTDVTINGQVAYISHGNERFFSLLDLGTLPVLNYITNSLPAETGDIAVRNGLGVACSVASPSSFLLFRATNPFQPTLVGTIATSPYQAGIGIALNDSLAVMPAQGANRLLIARYNRTDTTGIAPNVAITYPPEGTILVKGETVPVRVTALDDAGVAQVEFKAAGAVIGTKTTPPYEMSYTLPTGISTLQLDARAVDAAGNVGNAAARTYPVSQTDPLTTVTGRVVTPYNQAVANATVRVTDTESPTTQTDEFGNFSLAGVGTIPLGRKISVTVTTSNQYGRSGLLTTVRGGTTDAGQIVAVTSQTTNLPAVPVALGNMRLGGPPSVFVGYANRQSAVYVSDGLGGFTESSSYVLPFPLVRSGVSLDLDMIGSTEPRTDLLVQQPDQPGMATAVFAKPDGTVRETVPFPTGLAGECEVIAADGQMVGMLKRTGGTALTVRVRDFSGEFGPPISVPVDPGWDIRSLAVADVFGLDGLSDIVFTRRVSGSEGRLVVYPGTGPTTFGAPIESPVLLRTGPTPANVRDFAFGGFTNQGGTFDSYMAFLADDRLGIYLLSTDGRVRLLRQRMLPAGSQPYGLEFFFSYTPLVALREPGPDPTRRTLLVCPLEDGDPTPLEYHAPVAGTGDAQIAFGDYGRSQPNGLPALDILLVDGQRMITFLDPRPPNDSLTTGKANWLEEWRPLPAELGGMVPRRRWPNRF